MNSRQVKKVISSKDIRVPNSLVFYNYSPIRNKGPIAVIEEFIRANGKPHLEIAIDPVGKFIPSMTIFSPEEFSRVSATDFERIKRLVKQKGLSLSVHLPWLSRASNVDTNVKSSYPLSEKKDVELFVNTLEIAKRLGANLTVVHSPHISETDRIQVLKEVIFEAKKRGLPSIAIENAFYNLNGHLQSDALKFFDSSGFLDSTEIIRLAKEFPNTPICLDTAHFVVGELEKGRDIRTAILNLYNIAAVLGHRIAEVHVANVPLDAVAGTKVGAFKRDPHSLAIGADGSIITKEIVDRFLRIVIRKKGSVRGAIRLNVVQERYPKDDTLMKVKKSDVSQNKAKRGSTRIPYSRYFAHLH